MIAASRFPTAALLLAVPLAAQVPYGSGTPGSGGIVPRLSASQPFVGNPAFEYRIDRALGGAAGALLLSRAPGASAVFGTEILVGTGPSEFLFAAPLVFGGAPGVAGSGLARVPGGLTNATPAWIGASLFMQVLVADPSPTGAIVAASPGLHVEVTDVPLMFLGSYDLHAGAEPFLLIDPRTAAVVDSGQVPYTDDVVGAVFANGGRDVFVASRTNGAIERADLRASPPAWSTAHAFGAEVWGVAFDAVRRRIFTLVGGPNDTRDLVVLDGEVRSATFGAELARVPAIAHGIGDRHWALSASGRRLAIYGGPGAEELLVVDTDPSSPSHLQVVERTVVPGSTPPFNSVARVGLTPDGEVVLVQLTVGFATAVQGLHRYDAVTGHWIDHNPTTAGVQPIGPASAPRVAGIGILGVFDLARDGSFATIPCYDVVFRIGFDPADPATWTSRTLRGAWPARTSFGQVITADGQRVILLIPEVPLTDSTAWVIDASTGAVLTSNRLVGAPWISRTAER